MKVYAVRNKVTGLFANKYSSNKFYTRQADATRRANQWNRGKSEPEWEVVSSELNWEVHTP